MTEANRILCFNNANLSSSLKVDNASIALVNYHEAVAYSLSVDHSTINAILVNIEFQDFFMERYWVGENLESKINLKIDGM